MSDLYHVEVLEVRGGLELSEAVERAGALDLNTRSAEKLLGKAAGPYACCQVRFARDHPDADTFELLTPGFLHLLLRDVVPAIERVTPDDAADRYARRRAVGVGASGCVYRVDEVTSDQLILTIVCPEDGAPSVDAAYTSTAWVPDRRFHQDAAIRDEQRWYPAPGLAGALSKTAQCRPFEKVRKGMLVLDFAILAGAAYAVSHEGGHVARLDGKKYEKIGKPDRADGKRAVAGLHADGELLWIEWEDGGWTSVEPAKGVRGEGAPEREELAGQEHMGAGGVIEVAGLTLRYGGEGPLALEPTPDPETFTFTHEGRRHVYHAPTGSLPMSFGTDAAAVWQVKRRRPVLFTGGFWATTSTFDVVG